MPRSRICQFYSVVNFPKLAIESRLQSYVTLRAWYLVNSICASEIKRSLYDKDCILDIFIKYYSVVPMRGLVTPLVRAWVAQVWPGPRLSTARVLCSHSQHCSPSLQISGWTGCNTGVKMDNGDLIQSW